MKLIHQDISLILSSKPFAEGGEGALFSISSPVNLRHKVVKLYHPHKRDQTRVEKLQYLYKNRPEIKKAHEQIVWIDDLVSDLDGNTIGFLMDGVKGVKLENFCLPKLPKKLRKGEWARFSRKFNAQKALEMRLRLCYNVAVVLHQIHSMNRYVLVDLKPENVLVEPDGTIHLVDTDSIEVVEQGETLFDAPVATPEYTPPEFYREKKSKTDPTTRPEWDLFGAGVIFYKLLLGIHPFAASAKGKYANAITLEDKIRYGLYAHMPDRFNILEIVPPPHQLLDKLPKNLQKLFHQCFIDGHQKPALRPTAEDWLKAIRPILEKWDKLSKKWQWEGLANTKRKQKPLTHAVSIFERVKFPLDVVQKPLDWKNLVKAPALILPEIINEVAERTALRWIGIYFCLLIGFSMVGVTIANASKGGSPTMVSLIVAAFGTSGFLLVRNYSDGMVTNLDRKDFLENILLPDIKQRLVSVPNIIPHTFMHKLFHQYDLERSAAIFDFSVMEDEFQLLSRRYSKAVKRNSKRAGDILAQLKALEEKAQRKTRNLKELGWSSIQHVARSENPAFAKLIQIYNHLADLEKQAVKWLDWYHGRMGENARLPKEGAKIASNFHTFKQEYEFCVQELEAALRKAK